MAEKPELSTSLWELELEHSEKVAGITSNALGALPVLVGGAWVVWRYILNREAHPKIQFELELNILGIQAGKFLVEVVALVSNKGRVRHELRNFKFDLLYLKRDADLVPSDDISLA